MLIGLQELTRCIGHSLPFGQQRPTHRPLSAIQETVMRIRYCWRCKMDVLMLEGEESKIASQLYAEGLKILEKDRRKRFKKLLDYYNDLTGFGETEPNAIVHHFADMYGPDCESCGKPYRTSQASFCAACGNKREIKN